MEIVKTKTDELDYVKTVELAEQKCLKLPQVECPIVHRFGPGIYIREMFIPAGTFVIGHHHNFENTNIMLKGRLTLLNEDGTTTELTAPFFYVGKPGRKMAYIHEDVVWQNIYATDERDIEKLESQFITKSTEWIANKELLDNIVKLQLEVR